MKLTTNRGVLLLIASVVMVVAAVLTAVYLSGLVSEKKNVEDARYILQARSLAESGAGAMSGTTSGNAVAGMAFGLD